MEMFQQVIQPQTELDLFFASICKTVQKFEPMSQARIKIEINQLIGRYELAHLSNVIYSVNTVADNEIVFENEFIEDEVEI